MRTDFMDLSDGTRIRLFPNAENPMHTSPQVATYQGGYFYCDSSDPANGPDYYWRDVGLYNEGFEIVTSQDRER